jgi:hypothetical protein
MLTGIHTLSSLVALASGMLVAVKLLGSRTSLPWIVLYLASAAVTAAARFVLPVDELDASHSLDVVSLIVLPVVIIALYFSHLAAFWSAVCTFAAVLGLYVVIKDIPALIPRSLTMAPFAALVISVLAEMVVVRAYATPRTARVSPDLDRSLRRAVAIAAARQHGPATPEHLLLALTEDPDATAVMQLGDTLLPPGGRHAGVTGPAMLEVSCSTMITRRWPSSPRCCSASSTTTRSTPCG